MVEVTKLLSTTLPSHDYVSAIKLMRTRTGMGLKEAKDACDMIVGRACSNPAEVSISMVRRFAIAGLRVKVPGTKPSNLTAAFESVFAGVGATTKPLTLGALFDEMAGRQPVPEPVAKPEVTKPHRDDVRDAVNLWVLGALIRWNQSTETFNVVGSTEWEHFVSRTTYTVWMYLRDGVKLDGRCSDLECDLALRASKVFGRLL